MSPALAMTSVADADPLVTIHDLEPGEWLRQHRRARGWNIATMARKLCQAATYADDTLPSLPCLITMIGRWEKGAGISERYQLHFCHAFRLHPDDYGLAPVPCPSSGPTVVQEPR